MKGNLPIKILIFILMLSVFSCSDWEKDPVTLTAVSEPVEPTEVLMSTDFPYNISALYMKKNGTFIAGTSEGYFYKSYDFGKKWIKTLDMAVAGKITFFGSPDSDTSNAFLVAATTRGGYVTGNCGTSWNNFLPAVGSGGKFRELNYGTITLSNYNGKKIISSVKFYGFDGSHNVFNGLNPNPNTLTNFFWSDISEYVQILPGSVLQAYSLLENNDITLYSDKIRCAITCRKNNTSNSRLFNENMEPMSALVVKRNIDGKYFFFAGVKTGVMVSTDGSEWKNNFPKELKVYSLCKNETTNFIFAGTSEGLYASYNYGDSWSKVEAWKATEPVTVTYMCGDYLYFVSGSGKTYYIRMSNEEIKGLYIPVLLKPGNNISIKSSPVLEWVKMDDNNKTEYTLQISHDPEFKSLLVDTLLMNYKYQSNLPASPSNYYWRVRSGRLWGLSQWSDTFSFTIQ